MQTFPEKKESKRSGFIEAKSSTHSSTGGFESIDDFGVQFFVKEDGKGIPGARRSRVAGPGSLDFAVCASQDMCGPLVVPWRRSLPARIAQRQGAHFRAASCAENA